MSPYIYEQLPFTVVGLSGEISIPNKWCYLLSCSQRTKFCRCSGDICCAIGLKSKLKVGFKILKYIEFVECCATGVQILGRWLDPHMKPKKSVA